MAFDPQAFEASFMNNAVSDAMSTERPRAPDGQYLFVIDDDPSAAEDFKKIHLSHGVSTHPTTGEQRTWVRLNIPVKIVDRVDEAIEPRFQNDFSRLSFFLDIDDTGQLATGEGENVHLGRLRAAVGQNVAGQAWSPNMLAGQMFVAQLRTEVAKNGSKYSNVQEGTVVAPQGTGAAVA